MLRSMQVSGRSPQTDARGTASRPSVIAGRQSYSGIALRLRRSPRCLSVSSLRRVATAAFAGVLLAAGFGAFALAGEDLMGSWLDNIAGEMSVGTMTVKPGTIEFKRSAHYSVIAAGSFGAGDLFKVTGVNKQRDPM